MTDELSPSTPETKEYDDFSVVVGGPLYQIYLRTGLARRPLLLLKRRLILFSLLVWLPLLALSALDGTAFGNAVRIPFLLDIAAQAKYLGAVPLLLWAEIMVNRAVGPLIGQFVNRKIVRDGDIERFRRIVASALRLRNSTVIEIVLLVLVYTAGHVLWRQNLNMDSNTWFATRVGDAVHITRAGLWYAWVSAPVLQFLLLRWYFRLVVWAVFLFRVSRLDLHLIPTHPDQAGGLGFLNETLYSFGPLPAAQGLMMSSMIAEQIFYYGAKLTAFYGEIATLVIGMVVIFLGPLAIFSRELRQTKRQGLREYGRLGSSYVLEFDRKWLRGGAPPDEQLVGSGDIQSLADLSGSYDVITGMRPTPFGPQQIVFIALMTAAPILPLILTMVPLEELVKKVLGALF